MIAPGTAETIHSSSGVPRSVAAGGSRVGGGGNDGNKSIHPRERELARIEERSRVSEGRGKPTRSKSELSAGCKFPAAIPLPASVIGVDERKSHASASPASRHAGGNISEATAKQSSRVDALSSMGRSKISRSHTMPYEKEREWERERESERERLEAEDYSYRAPSRVSMGGMSRVAPPRTLVGGPGYAASVAPSDSVSSVGDKRERERMRMRMGDR